MPTKGEDKSNEPKVVEISLNNTHHCMNAQQSY